MPQVLVAGKLYEWSYSTGSKEFAQLARAADSEGMDVLRIAAPKSEFDVVIRVLSGKYSDGVRQFLGPMLVLGGHFPNAQQPVQTDILVELRPKLCSLGPGEPNTATVERIIQWLGSSRFRALRVNSSGGRWVGYGNASNA